MGYDDLCLLLDYHYWARDRTLEAIDALSPDQFTRDLGNSFKSIRDTAAHVYAAEWVWHLRWLGNSPTSFMPFETFHDARSIGRVWTELEQQVRELVRQLGPAGIETTFDYRLLNGTPGRSVFWQMMQHVVNHASYHRGQITTMLRQLGVAPPTSTDLITFYRERSSTSHTQTK